MSMISEQDQQTLQGLFEGLQRDVVMPETRFIQQVLQAVDKGQPGK